jgi:OmpR-family two-component system manganese-sensing sensor histidine kinase
LTLIHNEAEVALRAPRSSAEYCHALENMLEETNRLSQMADQLLFLCRQDAGLGQTQRDRIELDRLLSDVVDHMKVVASEKQITLLLDENPPCQILGDYHQLRRLFFNLLDNGIKYTGECGNVSVRSHITGGWVSISVQDSGIGIPEEHLSKVFQRFYRVDPSRSANNGSTGLGLSLCKSVVESTGGTINVESIVHCGTEFVVQLPMYVSSQSAPVR